MRNHIIIDIRYGIYENIQLSRNYLHYIGILDIITVQKRWSHRDIVDYLPNCDVVVSTKTFTFGLIPLEKNMKVLSHSSIG